MSSSRLEALESLRDILRASLDEAPADKRAPLAAQYRATLAEIATLTADEKKAGDPVDEIAARRAARGGATSRLGQAAGRAR